MACHIVYSRPYCNDAKEGVGGITAPKLNRGGWNSARTKYFEGNVVCKNLGAKNVPRRPPKTWLFFLSTQPRTISPTSRRPIFTKFSLEHVDRCPAKFFGAEFWIFFVKGSFTPQNWQKWVFLGTITRCGLQPRGYILGRLRSFSQLAEILGWSYGLGARERQGCPFFRNDARSTARAQAARRSI